MGIRIEFDTSGNIEVPVFVLAYKNGNKIGNITNVTNFNFKDSMVDPTEFSFAVHKKLDNHVCKFWNELKDFKLIWVPLWDRWFMASVELNESDETIKNVSCVRLGQSELSQIMLYNYEINTEADIARDDYKEPTIFYNPENPDASLLDRLLEKAPHYRLKHVDISLMFIQRTFSFNGKSIYDAFQEIAKEINCLFVFDSNTEIDGSIARTISVYDLEANCKECGFRGTFVDKCPECGSANVVNGYGQDTTIFISKDNLAEEITYTTDVDSVKNCFKLEAGDDLMTAAVRSCNPNGTDYLWYFSEEMKMDMSEELRNKITEYDELYSYYQTEYPINFSSNLINQYNTIVTKYSKYNENLKQVTTPIIGYPNLMNVYFDTIDVALFLESVLMPNIDRPEITAKNQCENLLSVLSRVATTSTKNLSVSTANNLIISFANSVVYSGFKVEIVSSSLSNTIWTGKVKITSYSDKDDTYTSGSFSVLIDESYEEYVKQRLEKILYKEDKNVYDIKGLFGLDMTIFKSELKKYCLSSLSIFQKCCQSCIDIMIQQGISDSNSTNTPLYNNLYIPYYNKLNAIQDEMKVRENEISIIKGRYNSTGKLLERGFQNDIEDIKDTIQDTLNFEKFLGKPLWLEFCSFRREDKYSNNNFVSDGLNNAELFQNALEFIRVATKEIYKSATLQHSISSSLKNFLRMKEFRPLLKYFEIGNWLRILIDDNIYLLRILEYEIDFDDVENISVTFSDVVKTTNGYSDLESILNSANNMATSYDSLIKQSEINSDTTRKFSELVTKGLNMTNTKIVSNAENQDITWDEHGLLCREFNDILDDYNPCQLKIINHGMYLTTDNWKTAKAGVGKFIYFDPKDSLYKEGYGVIADTIVSNLILSEEVGIYNEEKSIELGKNGIVVTTNTYSKNAFTIQREYTDDEGNIAYEKQMYIDDNGNIVMGGGASISWDNITGKDDVVTKNYFKEEVTKFVEQATKDLQAQIDGNITTWFYNYEPTTENYPASEWTTDDLKNQHLGDLFYIVNSDGKDGMCYRYAIVDGEYKWIFVEDAELTKALADAARAQDTADCKRRVFVSTPYPPYDIGDLWVQGENGDLMRCVDAKLSTELYEENDWIVATKYTDDTALNAFINEVFEQKINYILEQADKKTETWYQSTDPSTEWTTPEDKNKHKGDLWYNTTEEKTYIYNGTGWDESKSTPPDTVFDKIDGKAQIYMAQPVPPYHVGDLWFNGKEILTCVTARESGSFTAADWEKRHSYTDDSSLIDFINNTYKDKINYLEGQIDGKVETYVQSTDPSTAWTTPEDKNKHKGDLWVDGNKIAHIWNGAMWEEMSTAEIPPELLDKIDGKAQIFTTQPVPPYHVGDLWVQGATGDIMKCKVAREEGSYVASDWDKASKYTDDSKVNEISKDYETLKLILGYDGTKITGTYMYSPNIIGGYLAIGNASSGVMAEINSNGKLIATGAEIHGTIYAENGEFTGKITANSGKIGGFWITSDSLYSGGDYLGASGVYVSPNGISIGDMFKVSKDAMTDTEYNNGTYYGEIAGWYIKHGKIYTTGVNGKVVVVQRPGGTSGIGKYAFAVGGSSHNSYADCPFRVDYDGKLVAEKIYAKTAYNLVYDNNDNGKRVIWSDSFYPDGLNGGRTEVFMGVENRATTWYYTSGSNSGCEVRATSGDGSEASVYISSQNNDNTLIRFYANVVEGNIYAKALSAVTEVGIRGIHNIQLSDAYSDTYGNYGKFVPFVYDEYTGTNVATTGRINIGSTNYHFHNGYFDNLYIGEGNSPASLKNYIMSVVNGGESGTISYTTLVNKPSIGGVILTGNKTLADLSIGSQLVLSGTTLQLKTSTGVLVDSVSLSSIAGGNYLPATLSGSYYKLNANTLQIPNMKGYNVSDYNGSIATGIYMDDYGTTMTANNRFIVGAVNHPTVLRGTELRVWDSTLGKDSNDNYNYVTLAEYISSHSSSSGGTTNYDALSNRPYINNHLLTGNMSLSTLGIAAAGHSHSGYALSGHNHDSRYADTLSFSGTTLSLYSYSGTFLDSVDLSSLSGGGGGSSIPDTVIASDGGARPPISTGTGATQKVAYITANDTVRLKVQAQFGSSSYSGMYVQLATSDIRLKTNIQDTNDSGLPLINSIKMRQFDWINNGRHQNIGVIADELELLDKNLVFGGGYNKDGTMDAKTVNTFYLQGYEIKAIQELSKQNDMLISTVLQLQGEIAILKQQMS